MGSVYPRRTILLEGAPFPNLSPQCQRQDFLWSNHQANDIIPLPEQVHHHVSPEGWHPRVSWLPGACSNDLEFVDDRKAREERSARHMAWPGECLWICTSQLHQVCFEVLPHLNAVADILMQYFGNVFLPFATTNYMKGWQALEVSIMMGCIVSPPPFVMCMELIRWGTTTTTGGEETRSGGALPPSSAFMDDVTTLIQSKVGTQELLDRFHMGPDEGQTKEEPTYFHCLWNHLWHPFLHRWQIIPTVQEQPVKSLGSLYAFPLTDRHRGAR